MKNEWKGVAVAAWAAMGFCSCTVYDYPMYTSASVGVSSGGVSTSVTWTDARYDVNGFPIFGYSYGQPVYGYTASGAAVFSFYALSAGCCVPSWGPAHWYHGHWHYPRHIHRVKVPPRHPAWHHPGRHPAAPGKPTVIPRPAAPHRSVANHRPGPRPGHGVVHRPAAPGGKPGASTRPGLTHRPQMQKPGALHNNLQMSRPNPPSHRPQMQKPSTHHRVQAPGAAAGVRPQMNRVQPQRMQSRPQAIQRPMGGQPGGHRRTPGGGHGPRR